MVRVDSARALLSSMLEAEELSGGGDRKATGEAGGEGVTLSMLENNRECLDQALYIILIKKKKKTIPVFCGHKETNKENLITVSGRGG